VDKHLARYLHLFGEDNFIFTPRLSFHFIPSSAVYEISDTFDVVPVYSVDFGTRQPPRAFFQETFQDMKEFSDADARSGYIYSWGRAFENERAVAFSFSHDGKSYRAFHDKIDHETTSCRDTPTWTRYIALPVSPGNLTRYL
jgi:hypothetical protein